MPRRDRAARVPHQSDRGLPAGQTEGVEVLRRPDSVQGDAAREGPGRVGGVRALVVRQYDGPSLGERGLASRNCSGATTWPVSGAGTDHCCKAYEAAQYWPSESSAGWSDGRLRTPSIVPRGLITVATAGIASSRELLER